MIRSWSHQKFRFAGYENHYREHLAKLIADKVAGREVVAPAQAEAPPVINLMDALRRSLARNGSKQKPAAKKRPAKAGSAKAKPKRKAAS